MIKKDFDQARKALLSQGWFLTDESLGGGGANRNLEAAFPSLVFKFEKGFAILIHPQPGPGISLAVAEEQVGGTILISAYFASIMARSIPKQDLFHLDDPVLGLTLAYEEIGQILPLML